MTLQWTFVATFLYIEIGVIIVLLLPFISPYRWQKIFRSRIVASFSTYSHIYFNVLIGILCLLFLDACREVRKYDAPTQTVDLKHNPDSENLAHMKLFRAQRNIYISGFALFLWFVIRRLITLISQHAQLQAECEASQKQAKSTLDAAKKLMEEKDNTSNKKKEEEEKQTGIEDVGLEKKVAIELEDLKNELKEKDEKLARTLKDLQAVKSQAEGTNIEYDRLLKEHTVLQKRLEAYEQDGDKKTN
ncbi:hypothetical protein CHS0354_009571 [Potamilus streckersoni]|uniref:Endoplasmic reticulum transmembrane protein n=1 Tax=Potamilus streckersoni TaxID=2493646 RepID=A0AAE0SP98_9BIVA|nr:hypothetical protein CHS0354_009571 [Potamilus streckersoni]